MAATDVQTQVESLLTRRLAQAKVRGAPTPDVEAAAVFESIALNLLVQPRTVLFIALMARNGLLNILTQEIAAVDALKQTVSDLGNPSYTIQSTKELTQAKDSLLQLEQLEKINTSSGAYTRFNNSVNDFLNNQAAKSVKQPGATSLARPSSEAKTDLPSDFSSLNDLHSQTLERLYSLDVGVDNFLASPLSTVLGLATSARVRADLDSMLQEIQGGNGSNVRDYVNRLLADRAAVKTMGSLPDPYANSVDASNPVGYSVTGTLDDVFASARSAPGPFTFSVGDLLNINGQNNGADSFPDTGLDIVALPHIVGSKIISASSLTFPSDGGLFFDIDGTSYRIPLSGTMTISDIRTAVFFGSAGAASLTFFSDGTQPNPFVLAASAGSKISINSIFIDTNGVPDPINQPSVHGSVVYTDSVHDILGFTPGQTNSTEWTAHDLASAINTNYAWLHVSATENSDGSLTLTSTLPNVSFTIGAAAGTKMGFPTSAAPSSNLMHLKGTVQGVVTDPVDATSFLDPGDLVTAPTGDTTVSSISPTEITLADELPWFDGQVTIASCLVQVYDTLHSKLASFLETFLKSNYTKDLTTVDRAVAALSGSATPARRNAALSVLDDLRGYLTSLQTILQDPTTQIPTGAGLREKNVLDGIVQTLQERKYDKAQDMIMKCQIEEMVGLTNETASYGGSFMKAASDLYQNDMVHPNRAQDEGIAANGTQDRTV